MNSPLGSGVTNTTPNSLQTIIVPDTAKNGHYYNKSTGKYEGHLATKTGDMNDVYACTGKIGDGENATYSGAVKLDMNHVKFQTCANIFFREGGSLEEEEYLYFAYASFNVINHNVNHLYSKVMSGYSSVVQSDKIPMNDSLTGVKECFARKALIKVLTGVPDPSGGANYWDGTDFIAWGTHKANGQPHPKFVQNRSFFIPKELWQKYLTSQLGKYPSGHVGYSGYQYNIPAAVFLNPENWNEHGDFYYETSAVNHPKMEAVRAAGCTLFWKRTPTNG